MVDTTDAVAVAAEVDRQLAAFRRLMGREPTHLDSHQHVHGQPPVRSCLVGHGERLGVPVRSITPHVRYSGEFYGQDGRGFPVPDAISVASLIRLFERLPAGTTELGCHPGYGADQQTMYGEERKIEVETLCDAAVRAAVVDYDIRLSSFTDLPGAA